MRFQVVFAFEYVLVHHCINSEVNSVWCLQQRKTEEGGDAGSIVDWLQRSDGVNSGHYLLGY